MAAALIVVVGAIGYLFAGFLGAAMAIVFAAVGVAVWMFARATRGWKGVSRGPTLVMCDLCQTYYLSSRKCGCGLKPPNS